MSQQHSAGTILVVDSDVGFMLALAQELSQRQISAFPARSVEEARSLLAQLKLSPDAVVVNCSQPGACEFARQIGEGSIAAAVVGIVSDRHQCRHCADRLAGRFRDPEDRGPERTEHCADVIEQLVTERRRRTRKAGGN